MDIQWLPNDQDVDYPMTTTPSVFITNIPPYLEANYTAPQSGSSFVE